MNNLLAAIRDELKASTTFSHVRNEDIFVALNVEWFPDQCRTPFVGIKDGIVTRSQEIDDGLLEELYVSIIVWVRLLKPEAAILGDSSSGQVGILEVTKDIHEVLDANTLGCVGIIDAFCENESESELFLDPNSSFLQRKILTYKYTRERDRP